ncbi:PPOX class F420-dependent oxidoreductase [Amnibacterium endophyticum]|uniref:PPOX class F420-dependent oxidoreductase n=1 Tax=Amnibacterium endophyticum TaxID=2109337 RepID=A0ABW4LD10_9MICO
MTPALRAAGRRRYVALTTYRRSGAAVTTPVWVAPAGDALVVMTGGSTGKAKRLRRDPRVRLQECSMRGRVRPGAPVAQGEARLVVDADEQRPLLRALGAKYGWQLRLVEAVERVLGADADRVVLRITDPGGDA